jgi:hypothetical protein
VNQDWLIEEEAHQTLDLDHRYPDQA